LLCFAGNAQTIDALAFRCMGALAGETQEPINVGILGDPMMEPRRGVGGDEERKTSGQALSSAGWQGWGAGGRWRRECVRYEMHGKTSTLHTVVLVLAHSGGAMALAGD
jgi:hypothetical protein